MGKKTENIGCHLDFRHSENFGDLRYGRRNRGRQWKVKLYSRLYNLIGGKELAVTLESVVFIPGNWENDVLRNKSYEVRSKVFQRKK